MMDIIERAARAILAIEEPSINWDDLTDPDRKAFSDIARSVLMAIREPSDGMIGAAMDAGFGPDVATRAYQAMIDAALVEGQ